MIREILNLNNPSQQLVGAEKGSPVNQLLKHYNAFDHFENGLETPTCFFRAFNKLIEFYNKYEQHYGFAFFIELSLCETEKENCGADSDLEAYACGITNALLQEVNWLVILELLEEDYSSVPADFFDCIIDEYKKADVFQDDDEVMNNAIWRCTVGGTPDELISGISTFIEENWDDAYTQGQATVFVVTLLSPFKGKILTKAKEVLGKANKLDELAMATRADELLAISRFSTRLDDPAFLLLRTQLDELEVATRTKFFTDFSNTPDEVLVTLQERNLVNTWKKMDDLGADEALRSNPGALDALSKPQFERPNPSEYLDAGYISNHLDMFDGGVTKFVAETPTGHVGPPGSGGTFVMPKSQADDLIAEAGGDVNKLEDLLGLNRGTLGSNPVRVDISEPSGLRMPDGNELGANDNWIPGGKTSGGIFEATVDRIEPGTYTPSSAF